MFRKGYPFLQTSIINHISFATPLVINWLLLFLVLCKVWPDKSKLSWNFHSLIFRQQWRLNWVASWRNSSNVIRKRVTNEAIWHESRRLRERKMCLYLVLLKSQKSQAIDFQESLQRCCNVLLVWGLTIGNCYPTLFKSYLLTTLLLKEILNLPISKKQTSSSCSIELDETSAIKFFFRTTGFIIRTNCKTQNFSHLTSFTVDFEDLFLLNQITMTKLTCWKLEWSQSKR